MTGTEQRDHRVDELRARLRALGYLEAGVDRFVLAPVRGTRRPAVIAILASLRIGALAAVLLGPAAAVGLSDRFPGLITGIRDAVVLAGYMGLLFGLGIAAAACASSIAVVWLARHVPLVARAARPVSVAAGAIFGVLCLLYLTLWWQTASAGFGWQAPVWTGFALTVAVAISLLLGHAVTLTTLALTVTQESVSRTGGVPGTSWPVLLTAGVVAFAGAAVLLVLTTASADTGHDEAPPLTVVPSGVRVRLVAVDGFDPRIFEELSAAGMVEALVASPGTRAALRSDEATGPDPARTWTTIATGQPPAVHGVQSLETRRLPGVQGTLSVPEETSLQRALRGATDLLRLTRPALASGTARRAAAFWETAAQAGLRTTIVNWWATWPAPEDAGVVLSDRATLRLETGGDLDAEIAPASEYARLRERWPQLRARAASRAGEALAGIAAAGEILAALQRSAELDALQLVLASETSGPQTDLLAVYLPGLDIAQYALLSAEDRPTLAASSVAVRLDGIREYYVALSRLIGEALIPRQDEIVMLVTSPGRLSEGAVGLLVVAGSGIASSPVLEARPTDVAPSVLYALGVPISRELAGSPLDALFTPGFRERYPIRYVSRYPRPHSSRAARSGKPLDQEMIDRLRSLGYVK